MALELVMMIIIITGHHRIGGVPNKDDLDK